MSGFASKLAAAKLPERTVEICLRGDLQADFEALERQLAAALETAPKTATIVGNVEARRLAEEIELLRMEMADSVEVFRLRAMARGRYSALSANYPPVEGDEHTKQLGYNPEAFFPVALRMSIVEPDGIDDETWEKFLDSITDQQYNELIGTMQLLNSRPVNIPFSRAASALTRGTASES